MIGYVSQRVLGQYEVSLLGGDAPPAPAVRRAQPAQGGARARGRAGRLPSLDLRRTSSRTSSSSRACPGCATTWARCCATTFDASRCGSSAAPPAGCRRCRTRRSWSSAFREGGLAALVQTREQRALMGAHPGGDGGGRGLLRARDGRARGRGDPRPRRSCARRWTRRRRSRSAPERLIERLLGLDLKMRQYEQGKALLRRGGGRGRASQALNRVWESPEALPTPGASWMRPADWLARPGPAAGRRPPEGLADGSARIRVTLGRGGLQTCVRWYSSTELRSNKISEAPKRSTRSGRDPRGRSNTMATQTATQRKATAQKAAATRRRNAAKRSQSARKAAETRAQAELNTLQAVQAQAERAVLIPVGAALVARDAVVDVVTSRTSRVARAPRRSSTSSRSASHQPPQVRASRHDRPQPRSARGQAHPHPRRARAASAPHARPCARVKQNRREVEKQVKTARREAEGQAETQSSIARQRRLA